MESIFSFDPSPSGYGANGARGNLEARTALGFRGGKNALTGMRRQVRNADFFFRGKRKRAVR
jgi:hypothetical protein